MVPLTIAERKHRMPHGAQVQVATELELSTTYVSAVMNDLIRPKTPAAQKTLRRTQVALARKLGVPVDIAFPRAHLAHGVAHTGPTSGDDATEAHTSEPARQDAA